jgi:hypothetical protein
MQRRFILSVGKFFLAFYCFFMVSPAKSQTHTPITVSINSNCGGYYEYLPIHYGTNTSQKYPLIIYIHGGASFGNGSASSLAILLQYEGIPYYIDKKLLPTTFNTPSGGATSFIAISPQFGRLATPREVNQVIDYILAQNYRIDRTRIYLTGYSMGGNVVWQAPYNLSVASRFAAFVPVAGFNKPYADTTARFIAGANLPVWTIHSNNDGAIPIDAAINMINKINSFNPPIPAIITRLSNVTHNNTVMVAYDPAMALHNGLNIYQWMLQYSRSITVPLPVTLTDYKAAVSSDNSRVTVSWATAIEENSKYFILQRSGDGRQFTDLDTIPAAGGPSAGHQYAYVDRDPLYGDNFYRLTQVDIDGKTTFYDILKVTVSMQGQSLIRLNPNPAGNTVFLKLAYPEGGATQVNLADAQGRILKTWQFRKEGAILDQYLDISNIPPGNYFLHVQGITIRAVQQFIKK